MNRCLLVNIIVVVGWIRTSWIHCRFWSHRTGQFFDRFWKFDIDCLTQYYLGPCVWSANNARFVDAALCESNRLRWFRWIFICWFDLYVSLVAVVRLEWTDAIGCWSKFVYLLLRLLLLKESKFFIVLEWWVSKKQKQNKKLKIKRKTKFRNGVWRDFEIADLRYWSSSGNIYWYNFIDIIIFKKLTNLVWFFRSKLQLTVSNYVTDKRVRKILFHVRYW